METGWTSQPLITATAGHFHSLVGDREEGGEEGGVRERLLMLGSELAAVGTRGRLRQPGPARAWSQDLLSVRETPAPVTGCEAGRCLEAAGVGTEVRAVGRTSTLRGNTAWTVPVKAMRRGQWDGKLVLVQQLRQVLDLVAS